MISNMLVYVPKPSAITPNNRIGRLRRINTDFELFSQYVTISINTGKIIPKNEKHNAPISDANGPMFGMATANNTGIVKKKQKKTY